LAIVTIMPLGNVYYDPKYAAGFGSVAKLVKASKNRERDREEWLSGQNKYTLHKPVLKMFPRNPYTVTNTDVWETDPATESCRKVPVWNLDKVAEEKVLVNTE